MATAPMRIAVLHYQAAGDPVDPVVHQVSRALAELGHEAVQVAVCDRVHDILTDIQRADVQLVFNLCETFAEDYRMEVNVAALLELGRVRFTGSGTAGLLLAQDKILTKQLLEYHDVPTPEFAAFDGETLETNGDLDFPLIVKPARSDASIGIGRKSLVRTWDELTAKVRDIRRTLGDEALAEEFIEGREVYVAVLGARTAPTVLPIVELDFGENWDPARPTISDREVKFGPEGEGSPKLRMAQDISPELRSRIERAALLSFRALKLEDYARVDLRISTTGHPYVLEVNPNPYLDDKSELALAAKERGLSYTQLVGRIVDSALVRYRPPSGRKPVEAASTPPPGAGPPPVAAAPAEAAAQVAAEPSK